MIKNKKELLVIDQYFIYHTENTQKYGDKTIVFMRIGDFFEAYATDDNGYNLNEISKLLNIRRTRRSANKCVGDNSPVTTKNPYMLGFPHISIVDKLQILTQNGYTVVIVDQITFPPQPIIRKITGIYTPSTNLMSYTTENNFMISIYIKEEQQLNNKSCLAIGMSACDVTTGKVYIHEAYSSVEDEKYSLDETLRFIRTYIPKEILIHIDSKKFDIDYIKSYLDIEDIPIKIIQIINKHFKKIAYQTEVIKKVYPACGMINPLEYIGIERYTYCLISFIVILDHLNNINEQILQRINIPRKFCSKPTLHIGNNALMQLSIFNNNQIDTYGKKVKCLLDIVDNTSTSMGYRYLKNILCTPMNNPKEIQKIYDIISVLIDKEKYKKYEEILRSVGDIEKIYRKILIGIIKTDELFIFIQSIILIRKILILIKKNDLLNKQLNCSKYLHSINKLINFCEETFDMEKLKMAYSNSNISYYKNHIHNDIDELNTKINKNIKFIENVCEKLSLLTEKKNYITIKKNDRDGYYYAITKSRCQKFKEKLAKMKYIVVDSVKIEIENILFKPNPVGIVKIVISNVESVSDEIVSLGKQIQQKLKEHFMDDMNKISTDYNKCIRNITAFISKFDYYISNAHTAIKNNYTKPQIEIQESAYISCKQLRHPIIEKIIDHEYVSHNITIGTDDLKGILLYGLNSSGKSSIMKAIGISIIMAQSGMYVPASEFTYSPYSSIYTRISGNDNLFKELSSFSVEMVELKAIWNRADKNTLVIGDEVCRGTEHISGNAIVAATLTKLSKNGSTFIFATHLHDIVKLKIIQDLKNIKSFHLSVHYDEKFDRLIFDRTLSEGNGEEIYGITVAKYIIQDNEFTELTNNIKNDLLHITGKIINTKISKYNSQVYVHECGICKKSFNCDNEVAVLDTHHIHQQKDCENGVVKDKKFIKKNGKSNLIILCKSCHNKIHDGKINISSYVLSSDGRIISK